jgi:transposase
MYEFARFLNEQRNIVSDSFHKNIVEYCGIGFFGYLKKMRADRNVVTASNDYSFYRKDVNDVKIYHISSNFDVQLYKDVFTAYERRMDLITEKCKFVKRIHTPVYYKRNGKGYKKGDFKCFEYKQVKSDLCSCLTFIAMFRGADVESYVDSQLIRTDLTKSKMDSYKNIKRLIIKFGYGRLYELALSKKKNVEKRYNKTKIEFKSLNFRGRSRLNDIVKENKNNKSIFNAFVSLSWLNSRERIDIPVKYSKKYHGDILKYKKKSSDYEYSVVFTNKGKIKVNLCVDEKRIIPNNKTNYIGIDLNEKNNLFALSDGTTFDYNRKLITQITDELLIIDKLKSENKDYVVGKKKQKKLDSLRNKYKHSTEKLCSDVCKHLNDKGFDHAVFENLDGSFGKSYYKKDDVKYNRIIKELHLCSLKDMFQHISNKYDIAVSTVHAEYTSKSCSVCGNISDENRLTQEKFKCTECGFECNADLNAATNIKKRVSETVFRKPLLRETKIGNGTFEPVKMYRYILKEKLLSFRCNQEIGVDVIQSCNV